MKQQTIYDIPTRLFHTTFALLFIAAFTISKVVDDESTRYGIHMIFGMLLALTVLMRIVWGLIGTRYAQFSNFELSPKELIQYLKDAIKSKTKKYLGHNPASSYAAIAMMVCSLCLVASGYNMVMKNNKETFEEIHEFFAHFFLLISIFHVAGIALHTIKHRDPIGLSMITGKKSSEENAVEIRSHLFVGIIYLAILITAGSYLFSNYNFENGQLNLAGKTFVLVDPDSEK